MVPAAEFVCNVPNTKCPVEYVFPNVRSLFHQRQKGEDTKTFANALKAALREDPDIVLVGELRDLETITLAISAAETGHLVFGTLHTNSAAGTIDRMLDVFPANQQAQFVPCCLTLC